MQTEHLELPGTRSSAITQPSILNILHIPKTGGSSVWHTIADFFGVPNPPLAYDYFYEAVKSRLPFDPVPGAIHFLCVTGLLADYHHEIHEWHAASHRRFVESVRPTIADRRVLTHTHFPARFVDLPGEAVTVCTTRESSSRFLSHAAHLLRELRTYQDAVTAGECAPDPLIENCGFSKDKPVLDFCLELAALRPGIATHQLRYLLASLVSDGPTESFEIMTQWTNGEVIQEFIRWFDLIKRKTVTIRLEDDGRFNFSAGAERALESFGFNGFEVNRCVLETVTTPDDLRSKGNRIRGLFRADRAFFGDLASEDALLRELHGQCVGSRGWE